MLSNLKAVLGRFWWFSWLAWLIAKWTFMASTFNMASIYLRDPFVPRGLSLWLAALSSFGSTSSVLCGYWFRHPVGLLWFWSLWCRSFINGFKSKFEFPPRLNQTTCLSAWHHLSQCPSYSCQDLFSVWPDKIAFWWRWSSLFAAGSLFEQLLSVCDHHLPHDMRHSSSWRLAILTALLLASHQSLAHSQPDFRSRISYLIRYTNENILFTVYDCLYTL